MPSFHHYDHDPHSRPQERRGHSNEYHEYNEKMPLPYSHHYNHYEHDLRRHYPRTVPRAQSSQRTRRSWPPSPRVEDEITSLSREFRPQWPERSLEEAPFRGTVDQQTIIEDVNPQPRQKGYDQAEYSDSDSESVKTSSSSDSNGPSTPPDLANRNQDQRYVYIPKQGIEIPLTYDEAREPKFEKAKPVQKKREETRGRNEKPRLDTDMTGLNSGSLPPRERAPSPYAYAPKPKAKELHSFGDHLLSPDTLGPDVGLPQAPGREPSLRSRTREPSKRRQASEEKSGKASEQPRRLSRSVHPPVLQNTAHSGAPSSARGNGSKSTYYHISSDESDDNRLKDSRVRGFPFAAPLSPESPRKLPTPVADDPIKRLGTGSGSGLRPASPPPRARSAIPPPLTALPAGLVAANTLLASPPFSSRRASPRASPAGSPAHTPPRSPFASPPRTPPLDHDHHRDSDNRTRHKAPTSRAPPPPSPRTSGFLHSDSDHDKPSRRYAPRSRATSPMPLPNPTVPRVDIRVPSPANHQKSSSHGTDASMLHNSRHLSLAPCDVPPSTLKPPVLGQRRRASSSSDVRPQLSVHPTGLAPSAPMDFPASPRSPSKTLRPALPGRAVSMGALPISLLPCPRPDPVAGYDDWYTLAGGPSSFSICPTCRDTFISAGHERHLKPKSRHAAEQHLRCDMSLPWTRMAYVSLLKRRRPDLESLYFLAEILADEQPCPGNVKECRDWYRLKDPEDSRSVHDFQICPCCVQQLETVLPSLRGMFHRSRSHRSEARSCSLRADSKRFPTYLEILEDIAKQGEDERRSVNIYRFVDLAKLQECTRDDMIRGQEWYFHPVLPEFTVCEDCYEEVVWSAIKQDIPIASDFKRKAKAVAPLHVGVSCQLYSPRMRRIFYDACHRNDMQLLQNAALQRYSIEQDLQARNLDIQRWPRDERAKEMARLVDEWKRWE